MTRPQICCWGGKIEDVKKISGMLLNELISQKLEDIRKRKGIKVYTLCKKSAISYETYRSIRRNKNKDIYVRTLLILLKTLEVSPAEFFSDPMFNNEELDIFK